MFPRERLVAQFRKPTGALGVLAGRIMANRASNRARNRHTLDLLEIRSGERILELGFGPGWAIEQALARGGRMVGLDHSEVMLRQAARRNECALEQGRLTLVCGGLDSLAEIAGGFDAIFSCNVAQFWSDRADLFAQLRGLLAPGGRLATTYQPRHPGSSDQDARDFARRLEAEKREAGFERICTAEFPVPALAVCVLARR